MPVQTTSVNYSVSNGVQFLQQVANGLSSLGVPASMSGNYMTIPSMANAQLVGDASTLRFQNPYSGEFYDIPSSGTIVLFVRKDASGNPTFVSGALTVGYSIAFVKSGTMYFTVDNNGDIYAYSGGSGGYYYFMQPNGYVMPNFTVNGQLLLFPIAVFQGSSGVVLDGIYLTSQYIQNIGTLINANAQLCSGVSGSFYIGSRHSYPKVSGTGEIQVSIAVRDA